MIDAAEYLSDAKSGPAHDKLLEDGFAFHERITRHDAKLKTITQEFKHADGRHLRVISTSRPGKKQTAVAEYLK